MNGQKAKALRKLAHYSVTADRPQLPAGGWINTAAGWNALSKSHWRYGTCALPKDHPRRKYQFLKKRYGSVPLAHTLKRMHNSTRMVTELDKRIESGSL